MIKNTKTEYKGYTLLNPQTKDKHFVVLTEGGPDNLYMQASYGGRNHEEALFGICDCLSDWYEIEHLSHEELEDMTHWQEEFDEQHVKKHGLWRFKGFGEEEWYRTEPDTFDIADAIVRCGGFTMSTLDTDDGDVLLRWLVDNFNRTYIDSGTAVQTLTECGLVDCP